MCKGSTHALDFMVLDETFQVGTRGACSGKSTQSMNDIACANESVAVDHPSLQKRRGSHYDLKIK